MNIKGHLKIELINEKGEVVQTHEQDNTVTDFSRELFKYVDNRYVSPLTCLSQNYPLDSLFGGIMLFDKQIPDGKGQYSGFTDETGKYHTSIYAPVGTTMIGNGSISKTSVATTDPTEFGAYVANKSSSSATTRQYVYEWTGDNANGEINSICLSSRSGGFVGIGNSSKRYLTSSSSSTTADQKFNLFRYHNSLGGQAANDKVDLVSISGLTNRLVARDLSNGLVGILNKTIQNFIKDGGGELNWYLPNSFNEFNPFNSDAALTESTMKLIRSTTYTVTAAQSATQYVSFSSGIGEVILLGYSYNYNRLYKGYTIYVRRLNMDGTSNSWDVVLNPNGENIGTYFFRDSLSDNNYVYSVPFLFKDNNNVDFLVITNGSKTVDNITRGTILVINLSDGTYTEIIEGARTPGGLTIVPYYFKTNGKIYSDFYVFDSLSNTCLPINGTPYTPSSYYQGKVVTFPCCDSYSHWQALCVSDQRFNVYLGSDDQGIINANTSVGFGDIIGMPNNWLSTISNLDTPITKQEGQVMRITYTLRLAGTQEET